VIFRQLFDPKSSTYSYLLASRHGGEALIIDPVYEQLDSYLELLRDLDLRLVKAIDTHLHADHLTAAGALRDCTDCITVMGEQSDADVVGMRVADGETVKIEGLKVQAMFTPGHTRDSYSFLMQDRVFTGDTLLIGGTGRTDLDTGDALAQYDSLFNRLLKLPGDTVVYPGHDYRGRTSTTIGQEKDSNPRLQVGSAAAYVDLMNSLRLDNPKMMDVALPWNKSIGLRQDALAEGWSLSPAQLRAALAAGGVTLIDLRETRERSRAGTIGGDWHIPYTRLHQGLRGESELSRQLRDGNAVFYCAFGERSAVAVRAARARGLPARHLTGGLAAWRAAAH
jgi:sulfur dioxygenase